MKITLFIRRNKILLLIVFLVLCFFIVKKTREPVVFAQSGTCSGGTFNCTCVVSQGQDFCEAMGCTWLFNNCYGTGDCSNLGESTCQDCASYCTWTPGGGEEELISTSTDLLGWAWAENIGWVSFSSRNCDVDGDGTYEGSGEGEGSSPAPSGCPTSGTAYSYGVHVCTSTDDALCSGLSDPRGKFIGYAWSENVGWISFNRTDSGVPPASPYNGSEDYIAFLDDSLDSPEVYGWARALSYGDGWDGWIKFNNASYGVWLDKNTDPYEFRDWAWSDGVIGWLSFNCFDLGTCGNHDYKVTFYKEPESEDNNPPTASIGCDASGCGNGSQCNGSWIAYNENCIFDFINNSSDPDSDIVTSKWFIFDEGGTCINCSYPNSPYWTCPDDDPLGDEICDIAMPSGLIPSQTFEVRLLVEDSLSNTDEDSKNFYLRKELVADFQCSSSSDGLYSSCDGYELSEGETVYFKDTSVASEGGLPLISWNWTFEDGTPPSDTDQNSSSTFTIVDTESGTVTLQAQDQRLRTDSKYYNLQLEASLPEWHEIVPF